MPRDGSRTRDKILDSAEALILEAGFGATSIDKVLEGAGVTKGAFFHHFPSKADLGLALVTRYAERDQEVLETTMARAEKLSRDPLGQFLVFLGLTLEHAESLTGPNPGCLFASYAYEAQLFGDDVKQVISDQFIRWRVAIRARLDEIAREHPPRMEVDLDEVADLFTSLFEGGFVMAKTYRDPKVVARQLAHYRRYIELLFGVEEGKPSRRDREQTAAR